MHEPFEIELDDRKVQGTVGFNTVFLWVCATTKPKRLAVAELRPGQLRALGHWCLTTADILDKE